MPLQWTPDLSVNVKEIDEQHKHFIAMMNDFYGASRNINDSHELNRLFADLLKYAELHFSTEERYFDLCKYEASEEHRNEHYEMREKLTAFMNKLENGGDILLDLMDFLEDWLVIHLGEYDKKYTKCLNDHGYY
jgi:hemerythrin